jgi:hypothetical protein
MKKRISRRNSRILAAALCLFACSKSPLVNDTGGSGSTTTNGVVASVYTPQGVPAAGSSWRLRSADYVAAIPAASKKASEKSGAYLDDSGNVKIDTVDSGSYVLEVYDGKGLSVAFRFFAPGDGKAIRLADTLKPNSRLVGNVPPDMRGSLSWFVQIYGLERLAAVDRPTGRFVFPEVPAGTYALRFVSAGGGGATVKIDGVVTRPGGAALVSPFSAWRYSREFILNTTPSGAGIAGDVIGFPALVRLHAENFDFSLAQIDGSDVRFTKQDGTVLPHEIERWDPAAGKAEIWVRIDTVFGDEGTRGAVMFWGNRDAPSAGNGAAVFDTAAGFAGVWHLNGNFDDATWFGRTGAAANLTDTAGMIASCMRFRGSGFVKVPGLLGTPPALTLSAWAFLDTVKYTGAEVVSVGDAALIRMDDNWNSKGTQGAYCVAPEAGVDSTHCYTKSGVYLRKTGWHHLAYSVDVMSGAQRLFIDGTLCCSTESRIPVVYSGVGSDVYVGKHGNSLPGFGFDGGIDEVRVSRTVRSADWIRLSYMNQRQDDKLVKWK